MTDALELCQAILHLGPEEEVDLHAEKELRRHYFEYTGANKKALAAASFLVNGTEYASLLEALREEEDLQNLGIRFSRPDLRENWDYNTPTKTLVLMGRGAGFLERFSYRAFSLDKWDMSQPVQRENVMIRGFIRDYYYPRSILSESRDPLAEPVRPYIPKLVPLEEMWSHVRSTGMVPFEVRICAYTKAARYAYDIDMPRSAMLKDMRGGQAPLRNLAKRSTIDYLNFDMVLASTEMKDIVKGAFINLFEAEKATAIDIAHSMHITDQIAANALSAIAARGLAKVLGSPPMQVFQIDLEALAAAAERLERR